MNNIMSLNALAIEFLDVSGREETHVASMLLLLALQALEDTIGPIDRQPLGQPYRQPNDNQNLRDVNIVNDINQAVLFQQGFRREGNVAHPLISAGAIAPNNNNNNNMPPPPPQPPPPQRLLLNLPTLLRLLRNIQFNYGTNNTRQFFVPPGQGVDLLRAPGQLLHITHYYGCQASFGRRTTRLSIQDEPEFFFLPFHIIPTQQVTRTNNVILDSLETGAVVLYNLAISYHREGIAFGRSNRIRDALELYRQAYQHLRLVIDGIPLAMITNRDFLLLVAAICNNRMHIYANLLYEREEVMRESQRLEQTLASIEAFIQLSQILGQPQSQQSNHAEFVSCLSFFILSLDYTRMYDYLCAPMA